MSPCTDCGRKPTQPGTTTHTLRAENLWKMSHGWSTEMREAAKRRYCNTCGGIIDLRRRFYDRPESGQPKT